MCSCLLVFHSGATCVNLQKRLEFENACIGSLDPDVCASVFDGVMTKGLGSAVQTLVSLFNDVIGGAQANSVQSIAVRQDLFKDVSGVWLHTEHNTPTAPHGTHLPEHLPPLLTLSPSSIAHMLLLFSVFVVAFRDGSVSHTLRARSFAAVCPQYRCYFRGTGGTQWRCQDTCNTRWS